MSSVSRLLKHRRVSVSLARDCRWKTGKRDAYLSVEGCRMDALVRPLSTRNHSDEGVQVTFFNRLLPYGAI